MTNENNKTEWIDQYLNHTLAPQERIDFERRMQQDPAFRQEVEAQRAVRKSLQNWGNAQLKDKFKQFHANMKQEVVHAAPPTTKAADQNELKGKTRQLWSKPGVWFMAASISLMLVAGIVWINRDTFFGSPKTEITAVQTFQIPVAAVGSDNLGYAGENTISDSVTAQIITDTQYPFHYRFKDTLQIYSATLSRADEIMLTHQAKTDAYTLVINDKSYAVERGFNRIQELKEE